MALRVQVDQDPINAWGSAVARDTYIYSNEYRDLKALVFLPNRDEWCNERNEGTGTRCSRGKHPGWWRHVGSNGDYIIRVWGGDEPLPADTGELMDPEDGTPVDPPELMTADQITLGFCYRLRDRENQLYVIGGVGKYVRTDNQIEVLDLKRREFRVVPLAEMVPSDHVMSLDELSFTVEYVARVRQVVKSEAVAMYRQDKWCRDGLQSALKDLGMSPHKVELHGDMVIRIPWSAYEGAVHAKVESALKKALKGLDLGITEVQVDDNPLHSVELDPFQMAISVDNVGRH